MPTFLVNLSFIMTWLVKLASVTSNEKGKMGERTRVKAKNNNVMLWSILVCMHVSFR